MPPWWIRRTTTTEEPTTTEAPFMCPSNAANTFADPTDCHNYILCVSGTQAVLVVPHLSLLISNITYVSQFVSLNRLVEMGSILIQILRFAAGVNLTSHSYQTVSATTVGIKKNNMPRLKKFIFEFDNT